MTSLELAHPLKNCWKKKKRHGKKEKETKQMKRRKRKEQNKKLEKGKRKEVTGNKIEMPLI